MSNDKKETPPAAPPAEVPESLETVQAQHDALAEKVLELTEQLEAEKAARQGLEAKVAELEQQAKAGGQSASLTPKPPKRPELPKFKIGKTDYRFKIGAFKIGRRTHLAVDVVKDESLLKEVFDNYPGLYEAI